MAAAKTLTDRALRVVNCIEQAFWENGGMPTYAVIAQKTNESEQYVKGIVEKNSLARKALIVRGVDLRPHEGAQLLSSEQLIAANLVLNVHDTRSLREKLDLIGVSSQQWHAWLRQPAFSSYIGKRAESLFEASDYAAFKALGESVEEGDLNAVKLHFEMRGKYKNQLEVNVNIEQVLTQVVEIVAKHVNDTDTLVAIANELSQLGPNNNSAGNQQSSSGAFHRAGFADTPALLASNPSSTASGF